ADAGRLIDRAPGHHVDGAEAVVPEPCLALEEIDQLEAERVSVPALAAAHGVLGADHVRTEAPFRCAVDAEVAIEAVRAQPVRFEVLVGGMGNHHRSALRLGSASVGGLACGLLWHESLPD